MKMKKKLVATLLVGIMMLAACGGGKQEVTFEGFVTQALRSLYINNDYKLQY